jgi:hypothetical protein
MDLNSGEILSDRKELEKYSSAFTLSDMEIFIFPELFYPLVLADIMSPVISYKTMYLISTWLHGG